MKNNTVTSKQLIIIGLITVSVIIAIAIVMRNTEKSTESSSANVTQSIIRPPSDEEPTPAPEAEEVKLTLAEVSKHGTRDDCRMVIRDKVYDVSVSKFQDHPGGEAIFEG